ncbi:MAG TPA: pyrroline-5-carboxylate reductase [Candidatus Caccousia avicola]|uniref:Pyrroline-5-carboxylate reductase n=1 Tax=Candidatus Caccousia avicola TaxID=2840721 RepID=A0A9D1ANX8_9FIRM|nr:pyrroline-5-carboxylate reductase [Candidatus Caccousia avicola]
MKIGFIGCGNMAKAMIGGVIRSGVCQKEEILASDAFAPARSAAAESLGIHVTESNTEVAEKTEILVLAVKPQFYEEVTEEIRGSLHENQLVVTIAPGKTLAWLEEHLGKETAIVRTMPNTPAMVGEGVTAMCPNAMVTQQQLAACRALLESFGRAEQIPERLMDAVVAVSGSSPAYVFLFIEAMADAAVAEGMPRAQAYSFAAQAVLGSAKMVLETGKHPGELKDMVCSPAGTTIEAVQVLEETGLRSSVMQAMRVCAEKSRSMGGK